MANFESYRCLFKGKCVFLEGMNNACLTIHFPFGGISKHDGTMGLGRLVDDLQVEVRQKEISRDFFQND